MEDDKSTTAVLDQKEPQAPAEKAAPARPRTKTPAADGGPRTAVRVTFTDVDEFMVELIASAADIEGGIVRTALRETTNAPGWLQRELQVLAGYVARGQVVELLWTSPSYWGNPGEASEEPAAAAAEQLELLRTTCEAGGLEVRGGRFGAL